MKSVFVFIFSVVTPLLFGQVPMKNIKAAGDYTDHKTGVEYPLVLGDLTREKLHYLYNDKDHIYASYEGKLNNHQFKLSIYVYPGGAGSEGRLRNHFIDSYRSISSAQSIDEKGLSFIYKTFSDNKYNCNGLYTSIINNQKIDAVTLYECGKWLFKIRTTGYVSDTTLIKDYEDKITKIIKPSALTAVKKLNDKATINFGDTAFADSLLLGCTMGSAYAKLEWAYDNVSAKERASGFPDLYLELHTEGVKGFMDFYDSHPEIKVTKEFTKNYINDLRKIIDAGFLSEYLMEQYDMVMIKPQDLELRFKEYYEWKISNPFVLYPSNYFYVISFD